MSEIQKWADQAMFRSETMLETKPRVFLLDMTQDPLGEIAACAKMYKGEVVKNRGMVTDEERLQYFSDGHKTVLGAPFEAVNFHFMFEGVTRAFTHQLVRQRTAVYFQESMRFAVVGDRFSDRVGLPPSLDGTKPGVKFLEDLDAAGLDRETNTSDSQRQRIEWDLALSQLDASYKTLVDTGMPQEDARGLLPTNILTRVHYLTNYRNLMQHAGNRLCTQAQFEWRYVFNEIVGAIKNAEVQIMTGPDTGSLGSVMGAPEFKRVPVYMREQLAQGFAPVCYQTGKCGFKASFDRACTIRDRVDAFAESGVPSSQWGTGVLLDDPDEFRPDGSPPRRLLPIYPAEWALDAGAARS